MSLAQWILSYGGCGRLPVAPGTWGTLGAMITAIALFYVPALRDHWVELCAAWIVVATALCVLLTPEVEKDVGKKDPGVIVMDEVAGYWATLIAIPEPRLTHFAAAFFLFRLLDIVKPWPAGLLERLPSGWGVALDDVMAGLYGAAILFGADYLARNA